MSTIDSRRSWPLLLAAVVLVVLVLGGLGYFVRESKTPDDAPIQPKVRLAVLVVFDQLRGDYLERWRSHFGKEGFERLMSDGAWFDNCHYPYAVTKTAAGHASLLTGCSPDRHGILDNNWYERSVGKEVYCVASERYAQVPPKSRSKGVSPERLLAPGVGDVLKEKTRGLGRIVSLSLKDRSAVLPAGKRPDACYWFDSSEGQFVTSTYYRDAPHAWVTDFHRGEVIERWRGKSWTPLVAGLDLDKLGLFRGPDAEEGDFDYPLPEAGDSKYYAKLSATPYGNDVLLELAKRAIDAEQLGQDDVPDLLTISFSSNDLIGHLHGPDSPEVMDVTVRSDRTMAELLAYLDAKVGKDHYVVAVSADHGICPLPEVSRRRGHEAGRIVLRTLARDAGLYLDEQFGDAQQPARWFDSVDESWLHLNRALLASRRLDSDQVADKLARWLEKQEGIQAAYTRRQVLAEDVADDAIARAVRRSYHPDRGGDVVLIQKPLYLFTASFATGTTHGTPHAYDTHVPLLVGGPEVAKGRRSERVAPQDITPIFAYFLGLPQPASSEASLPAGLLRTGS